MNVSSIYVSILLAIGLIFMGFGWNGTHNKLIKERAQHELVVQQFKDTQAEANRKAEAKRVALEQESKRNAEQADKRYSDLYDKYRANLLRYQASQGSRPGPYSGSNQATEGSSRPSTSSELSGSTLTITLKDAEICAINTARLQAVQEWAKQQLVH